MDWLELLYNIFEVCVIPLLGVLTVYAVKFIKVKSEEIQLLSENELVDKYVGIAADTISACVLATNQTYVDTLKAQGKFDAEAQKEAFAKTADAVKTLLSDEAKAILSEAFGDLEVYITTQIEASVKFNKQ
jgi:hypothetical protein